MGFFTEKFLTARRNELLRSMRRFQYQLDGGSWYDGEIDSKELEGQNVVVYMAVPGTASAYTITGVRIYDRNGDLAGSRTVNVKADADKAAAIRFEFPLFEVDASKL